MDLKLLVDGARDYQPVAMRISGNQFLHPTTFYSGCCYDPSFSKHRPKRCFWGQQHAALPGDPYHLQLALSHMGARGSNHAVCIHTRPGLGYCRIVVLLDLTIVVRGP